MTEQKPKVIAVLSHASRAASFYDRLTSEEREELALIYDGHIEKHGQLPRGVFDAFWAGYLERTGKAVVDHSESEQGEE